MVTMMQAQAQKQLAKGFVYVIRNGGLIKIGRTDNPKRRMSELKPDEIIAVQESSDSRELEKKLHRKFNSKRLPQSEYFRITPEDALKALNRSGLAGNESRLISVNPGDKDYRTPIELLIEKRWELLLKTSIVLAVLFSYVWIYLS